MTSPTLSFPSMPSDSFSSRQPFSSTTNSTISTPRPSAKPRGNPSSSRKSLPTCTVSLANVSASYTNQFLFPTTLAEPCPILEPINPPSQVNPIDLLREAPFPSSPRKRARTVSITTRRCRPRTPSKALPERVTPKKARPTSPKLPSDVRFFAMVQRSVAWNVLEREYDSPMDDEVAALPPHRHHNQHQPQHKAVVLSQDLRLATLLHNHLASSGCPNFQLIDLDNLDELANTEESSASPSPFSFRVLSPTQLVAASILRNRYPEKHRSERSGGGEPGGKLVKEPRGGSRQARISCPQPSPLGQHHIIDRDLV